MLPIAARPNFRDQVFAVLEGDATLLAYLANGVNSLLPRKGIDPATAKTPFVFLRIEGVGSTGLDNLDRTVLAFEVHDRPGYGLVAVDKIVARLKVLFNHRRWEMPTAGTEWARRSWWAGATGELVDQGWNTVKRIARVQVFQS